MPLVLAVVIVVMNVTSHARRNAEATTTQREGDRGAGAR